MTSAKPRVCWIVCAFLSILLVVFLSACSSAPSKSPRTVGNNTNAVGAAAKNVTADIDLNCALRHIESPPESFHYSFKDVSDNPWQEDADITPQTISGTFMDNSSPKPQSFQGPPQQVASNLRAIGRMASIFSTIHMTSAVVNEGTEQKNGYSATRFSVDTSRGNSTELGLFKSILGPGGFEKGTVWATSDGCPVQIVLDEELHARGGSLQGKAHYEEAMIKK